MQWLKQCIKCYAYYSSRTKWFWSRERRRKNRRTEKRQRYRRNFGTAMRARVRYRSRWKVLDSCRERIYVRRKHIIVFTHLSQYTWMSQYSVFIISVVMFAVQIVLWFAYTQTTLIWCWIISNMLHAARLGCICSWLVLNVTLFLAMLNEFVYLVFIA